MNLLKNNLSNGPYLGKCLSAQKVARTLSFRAISHYFRTVIVKETYIRTTHRYRKYYRGAISLHDCFQTNQISAIFTTTKSDWSRSKHASLQHLCSTFCIYGTLELKTCPTEIMALTHLYPRNCSLNIKTFLKFSLKSPT